MIALNGDRLLLWVGSLTINGMEAPQRPTENNKDKSVDREYERLVVLSAMGLLLCFMAPNFVLHGLQGQIRPDLFLNDLRQRIAQLEDWMSGSSIATVTDAVKDPKVKAMLATISVPEGTSDSHGYRRQFTGTIFSSFSDHPREIRCAGKLCSDAAGKYQFLSTTWDRVSQRLRLRDFSPQSQDLGAVELLREQGALQDIQKGKPRLALKKIAPVWASIEGAGYGQREMSLDELEQLYWKNLQRYQRESQSVPKSSF